ncbi:MAG TPA: hypothetical protein VGV61_10550 [Thermoanaerobaculia bacterium]|nr:hypothetical protein [Thermoanaerobaculia bacterium]
MRRGRAAAARLAGAIALAVVAIVLPRPSFAQTPRSPTWLSSKVFSWNPTQSDVGVWETYIRVKDGSTPANQNTYGWPPRPSKEKR